MKKIAILLSGVSVMAALSVSALTFHNFRTLPPVTLPTPAQPDSLQKENPFAKDHLLKSRLPLDFEMQRQDWTTLTADTTGCLHLGKPEDAARVNTLVTRVRAPRYAKGKLELNTNTMAEVLLNGKSIVKKTSVDSLATKNDAAVELLPEVDYDIQINLLSLPDSKSDPLVSLKFIPDSGFEDIKVEETLGEKARFTISDITDGPRVSSAVVSPDGKYTLVNYSQRYSENDVRYWAKVIDNATGKNVAEDITSGSKWLPDGSTLYYVKKRNGVYDIHTVSLPTLRHDVIARGVPVRDFDFSPDRRFIVYYDKVDGKREEGTMRRIKDPDDRQPGMRDRYYLVRYELEQGVAVPLTYGGASTTMTDFSADGSKLVYLSTVYEPSRYPFYFSDIVVLDMETLATDTVAHDVTGVSSVVFSPDSKRLAVAAGPEAFGSVGVNAGNHEIANEYDVQGYILDISTRKAESFTRDFDPALEGDISWNVADGNIYFRGQDGFSINLYSYNPTSRKIKELPSKIPSVLRYSVGADEKQWLAYSGQSFDYIGRAYLMNLKTGESRLIDDPMNSILSSKEMGKVEPWKFTSTDGTLIDGVVCYPPAFDPSKKYPLIVYYYGGTTPCIASMGSPYSPQVFASRDYVVYVVNPSGTIGYGQEFSARHVNAWGKQTADDIITGVKEFVKTHPFVDDKKIGCLGASYGGFMTQYLQTKTDMFAAAVSHAGISNVTSYWGEGYWGYSYNAVAAAKSYPWTNPDLFTKQGSLFNADKIKTPLLLLHGTVDTNVPIGESIQLYNALKILGKNVEFITVEDQDHIISDYDKRKVWQNTIMAWFAKYLQDDPRWWDSLYGE